MKKISVNILILLTFGFGQNSLYTSKSMFTDIKAHDIGDVITVLIAEMSNASRASSANMSASSGIGADGSISGNLSSFIPLFGMSTNISEDHKDDDGTLKLKWLPVKLLQQLWKKIQMVYY